MGLMAMNKFRFTVITIIPFITGFAFSYFHQNLWHGLAIFTLGMTTGMLIIE